MNSIDDIKRLMNLLPFDKETKDKIVNSSEEINNFNIYIASKYKISQKDAENLVKEKLTAIYQSQDNSNLSKDESFEVSSENTKSFAEEEGYERSLELKMAILDLSSALKVFVKK